MTTQPTSSQLESAARGYCQLAGLNPDELLRLAKPLVGAKGPINEIARWEAIVPAVLDQWRLLEALKTIVA